MQAWIRQRRQWIPGRLRLTNKLKKTDLQVERGVLAGEYEAFSH
jgi:hypothetical protein